MSEAAFGAALWSCLVCLHREKGSFVPCARGAGAPAQALPYGEDGISLQPSQAALECGASWGTQQKEGCEVKAVMQPQRCEFLDFTAGNIS